MLLPLDAPNYRQHVAYHTAMARVNARETVPDYRFALTQVIENRVREELQSTLPIERQRVLRWEEPGPTNRWRVRYRELDGVYNGPGGATVLLEVKASASKSSLESGLRQLRAAVNTLAVGRRSTCGLLVVADLGAFVEGFGAAAADPVTDFFNDRNVSSVDWPPVLPGGLGAGLFVSVIPESIASAWLTGAE